jgi:hypothetical protein
LIDLRRTVLVVTRAIEERFDAYRFTLKRRLGVLDPFEIRPYRGHGTSRELFLRAAYWKRLVLPARVGTMRCGKTYSTWHGASPAMKWPARG